MNQFASGISAELYVAHKMVEKGFSVYWPLMTQSRCDIVIELDGEFKKVQVKKATYKPEDVDLFTFTDNKDVWIASYNEVGKLTSVCLMSTNPFYKPQTKYNANEWKINA